MTTYQYQMVCPNDIEMGIKQGFSVFVMNWGDPGLAIGIGKKAAGR